ncbi:MAG: DNA translocase FtsK, partial [Bacteroidales bacterium]|nr:DNA translocase FtsK [Bacteroidales bacterium]
MYKQGNNTTRHSSKSVKTKAKKTKTSSKGGFFTQLGHFLKHEKMIQIYGLLLISFSLLLLISIVSFMFNATEDMTYIKSHVENPGNWIGNVGAYLGYSFSYYFFGIFSLGFILLLFIYGVKITFDKALLPLLNTTITICISMTWCSMALALFTEGGAYEYLSGTVGNYISEWLLIKTGNLGTVIITITSFFIIAILFYGLSIRSLAKIKLPKIERKKVDREYDEMADFDYDTIKKPIDTKEPGLYIEDRNTLVDEYDVNKIHFEVDYRPAIDKINKNAGSSIPAEEHTADFVINDPNLAKIEDDDELLDLDNQEEQEFNQLDYTNLTQEDYDPRADLSHFEFPPIDLLKSYEMKEDDAQIMRKELLANKNKIETTLKNFGILIKSITATIGPTVTLYEIVPADGVRINKIKNLEDDIALSLAALGIRIIAPIPGRGTIGIEVPNQNPKIVSMREIIESDKFTNNKSDLPIGLGKTISNEAFVVDLAKMPHLLMAGATGQGKSVGLNAIITSLLYTKHPSELKFVMIDPKKVEFSLYSLIENHYLAKMPDVDEPVITDTKKVIRTLNSLCKEMDDRYDLLKLAKARHIKEYNAKFCAHRLSPALGHRYLPYIILLIDEFGDLIMTAGREVETPIARLAQLARAIGIHLIIATQRPSVNIITGSIKANFPARIAFRVSSNTDSRTILDGKGAEQLIGKGDMLISTGSDLIRLQCAFVDTPEVENIVKFIENQNAYPEPFLLPEVADDEKNAKDDDDDFNTDEIDPF